MGYTDKVIQRFRLNNLKKVLKKVNRYRETMRSLSDDDLASKTQEFQKRLAHGESLDDLLPEAFAVVREVDYRVLGLFPYDVQVLGAIALHQGYLAEMKTGEGKTLTATMPLYLNALSRKGVFLVTTNGYLANRDGLEIKPVFTFLGLTVGIGGAKDSDAPIELEEKKHIYSSDIVYITNSALGFDYLFDNLASNESQKFMRPFHYAIVDEADEVLLDVAQTPLVISGSPRVQSNYIEVSSRFVESLIPEIDYHYDEEENEIWLTQKGINEAESFFDVNNLFSVASFDLTRQIMLALRAYETFKKGKDYLIKDGKVNLLDSGNGRIMVGTRLQGGIHQAIEAKEKIELTQEQRAVASITYQNLFQMFPKLSGMTGTGKSAENEFIDIYDMPVIQVPTNVPVQRQDLPDRIFSTLPEKISAIIDLVKSVRDSGRPILLVTASVTMSELYSELLLMEEIPHNLLNAGTAAKEAQMISEAGQVGSVIVATNMAGRGTDIKLSPEAKALGGLYVIGTERMANERMDLQMRGRAGRQGDPGTSQFFVSLEDELLIKFMGAKIDRSLKKKLLKVDYQQPRELYHHKYKKWVTKSQKSSEFLGRTIRSTTVDYDRSVRVQRQFVYEARNQLLQGKAEGTEVVLRACTFVIKDFFKKKGTITAIEASRFIYDNIAYNFDGFKTHCDISPNIMLKMVESNLIDKQLKIPKHYSDFCNAVILKALDESWTEEVDYLQQLRRLVSGHAINQRNPVLEYHKEAFLSYSKMQKDIAQRILQYAMLSEVSYNDEGDLVINFI